MPLTGSLQRKQNGKGHHGKKVRSRHGSKRSESTHSSASVKAARAAAALNNNEWRIAADELERGKKIGSGAFGEVFKGRWRGVTVAIKQVRGDAIHQDDDFALEAARMQSMYVSGLQHRLTRARRRPHKNVVTFYGIATVDGALALVTEYCSRGALSDALYGENRLQWTRQGLIKVAVGAAAGISQ